MKKIEIDGTVFHVARLSLPHSVLLAIRAKYGFIGCGYISIAAADKLTEALAVVTGVSNFSEMLSKPVVAVSSEAKARGVTPGMSGRDALFLLNQEPAK